jgi:GTPase SAR1 family protein
MGGCIGRKKSSKNETLGIRAPKTETDHKYKVVVLGDVAVGKTSILSMLKGKNKTSK